MKRWPVHAIVGCAAFLGPLASSSASAKTTGLAIMQEADKRHRLPAERTDAIMQLQAKGEAPRERHVISWSVQNDKTGDRTKIRFESPANVKGTTLLSVEQGRGGTTEQWLYLPAFRRTRRVGETELGDRFVGTDFLYEDMKRRLVKDFAYTILRSEACGAHQCWVIESKPKAPQVKKESPYGKTILWVRKDIYFTVKARFFDRRLRPLKELQIDALKQAKGQAWRADETMVVDVQRNHRTMLKVTKRELAAKFPPKTFSKHSLTE